MPALADRTQRKLICLLLGGAFLAMLHLTWMRWGSFYVDTFRDQWVYHNILSGKVVYRDFCYRYGFFPPYLGALFYRFFGETLYSSLIFGLAFTIASIVLIYRIARFFLSRFITALLVLNFIVVFAFGGSSKIFNFIIPYSSSMTISMLFTLALVYFALKFILKERRYCLYCAAVSLYFILISRYEIGVMVSFAVFLTGLVQFYVKRDLRLALFPIYVILAGIFSYIFFIYGNQAYAGFRDSVGGIFSLGGKVQFFHLRMAGLVDPGKSFLYAIKHFAIQLVVALFFVFAVRRKENHVLMKYAAYLFLILFLPLIMITGFPYYGVYAALPLSIIGGIVFIVYYFKIRISDFKVNLALFLLFSTALAVSMRVIFNFSIFAYGFAFGALALIPFYIFWFKFFPAATGSGLSSRSFYSFLFGVFLILFNIPLVVDAARYYLSRNVPVESARGRIFSSTDPRDVCFWQTIDYLNNSAVSGQTLIVMPEGIGINYFSNLANPIRYDSFIPPDIDVLGGDDRLIGMLIRCKADYLVITARETPEYTCSRFGVDYAKRLSLWIKANYHLDKVFGEHPFTSPRFGIAVYRRK